MPSVLIERPSIPTLWIDTAVAVNLALGRDEGCEELQSMKDLDDEPHLPRVDSLDALQPAPYQPRHHDDP